MTHHSDIGTPYLLSNNPAWLPCGAGKPEMGVAAAVEAAASCGAGDEAELNEIGLDHVLDRVARLDRPAARVSTPTGPPP